MKGQEEAKPPPLSRLPIPFIYFVHVCFGRAGGSSVWLWGGPSGGNPSPRRRGLATARPIPAPTLRGGEGKEEGGSEWETESWEKEAAGAPRGGGETGPSQAAPPRAAGGVRRGSRCRCRRRLPPGPEGAGVERPVLADPAPGPTARPPFRSCASAPRPWLRAGGGRTRRKSCANAASSGARAAPGAVRCRATRPQVRGVGSARGCGRGGDRGLGAPGPRRSCPGRRPLPHPSGWDRHLPLCGGRRRESGFSILILTLGPSPQEIRTGVCQLVVLEPKRQRFRAH